MRENEWASKLSRAERAEQPTRRPKYERTPTPVLQAPLIGSASSAPSPAPVAEAAAPLEPTSSVVSPPPVSGSLPRLRLRPSPSPSLALPAAVAVDASSPTSGVDPSQPSQSAAPPPSWPSSSRRVRRREPIRVGCRGRRTARRDGGWPCRAPVRGGRIPPGARRWMHHGRRRRWWRRRREGRR